MNRLKWMAALMIPLFFTTGCWDSRDPEDREYVITMGIDRTDEGYLFSFAPAKTEEKDPEAFTMEGRTLAEAVTLADCKNSRKTEMGQLKMVIFGSALLEDRESFLSVLDELEASREISEKIMVLGSTEKAESCIQAMMKEDAGTGLFLWDFYKNTAQEVAVTKGLDMDTFLTEKKEQKGNAVLPLIVAQEEGLRLGGGIVLVEDTAAFTLNDKAERGYLFLLGEADGAVLQGEMDGRDVPLKITRNRVSYDFEAQDDKNVVCRIQLKLTGDLLGGGNLLDQRRAENLEKLFSEIIKKEIENTIAIAREEGQADFFGITPRLLRQIPSFSGNIWEDMTIFVEPEVNIRDTGKKR